MITSRAFVGTTISDSTANWHKAEHTQTDRHADIHIHNTSLLFKISKKSTSRNYRSPVQTLL